MMKKEEEKTEEGEAHIKGEEGENQVEDRIIPNNTSKPQGAEEQPHQTSLSPGDTEYKVATTLATLGTSLKPKRKQ